MDSEKISFFINSNDLKTSSKLSFEISNYLNPYSVGLHSGINIYILNIQNEFLAQKLNNSFKVLIPSTPQYIDVKSTEKRTGKITNLIFSIVPRSFLYSESGIDIIFPREFVINSNMGVKLSGNHNTNPNFTYIINNNQINITNLTKSYIQDDVLVFQIENLVNPSKSINTSSFGVILKDKFGSYIEKQMEGIIYTVEPGNILNFTAIPDSNKLDIKTNYFISFVLENYLNYFGYLFYNQYINF